MRIAIVLSGGKGTRLGGEIPKQYIKVADKMIITYCLETISKCVDKVFIVADYDWHQDIIEDIEKVGIVGIKDIYFSAPGETRQLSIYNALKDIDKYLNNSHLETKLTESDTSKVAGKNIVIIHDAARPFVTKQMCEACLDAIENGAEGALPVLPMKDTIYFSDDGQEVTSLLDRNKLFAGQAPEAFLFEKYFEANERLLDNNQIFMINGSTEPAILAGMKVQTIKGDENNYKITTKTDLERFISKII